MLPREKSPSTLQDLWHFTENSTGMPITLTRQQKEQASIFLLTSARPLEWALYAYYFEAGHLADVLEELTVYRNADGGFGQGLEPDLRDRHSSVICTTIALQVLRELHVPATNPLVYGAINYLMRQYDEGLAAWPIIAATANDAPHAPWWQYDSELAARWGYYQGNPRPEIIGYLYDYAELIPESWLNTLTDAVLAYLELRDYLEMHELFCYIRLAETAALPEAKRTALLRLLTPIVNRQVVRELDDWAEYCLKPLSVVSSPQSPFAQPLSDEIEQNLDYEIFSQMPDGAWTTTFSWFGAYPDIWPNVEREWDGIYTLRTLLLLKKFNRLD